MGMKRKIILNDVEILIITVIYTDLNHKHVY